MKRVVVIGAGGMARELKSLIRELGRRDGEWEFVGYVVTDLNRISKRDSREEILGDYQWFTANQTGYDGIAIGVGSPDARLRIAEELREMLPDAKFPALIHPSAYLEIESATIGEGVLVCAGVVGTINLVLDPFALCNFGSTLGHEAHLGRASVVNPGANISGGVEIGAGVLVGTGAQILQYRTVGDFATVGAGAVVVENVPAGTTVVGVPARPLRR